VSVCFKIFDTDHDGQLSHSELRDMMSVMLHVRKENTTATADWSSDVPTDLTATSSVDTVLADILSTLKKSGDVTSGSGSGGISQEEYLMWAVNRELPATFLNLLVQVNMYCQCTNVGTC